MVATNSCLNSCLKKFWNLCDDDQLKLANHKLLKNSYCKMFQVSNQRVKMCLMLQIETGETKVLPIGCRGS